jgi:hypothetical protein
MEFTTQLLEIMPWLDAAIIVAILGSTESLKRAFPKTSPRLISIVVTAIYSLIVYFNLDISVVDGLIKSLIYLIGSAGSYALALKTILPTKVKQ